MVNLLQQLTKPSPTNAPPTAAQTWRNDLAMVATLVFALFLGIGIRNRAYFADQRIELGDNLPVIMAPAGWMTKVPDIGHLQIRNPGSASSFKSEIEVQVHPLAEDSNLELVRLDWSLQRAKLLEKYREFDVQFVEVRPTIGRSRLKAIPGALTTYAYIADPSLEQGAGGLPVVIEAQDLIFTHENQTYIITVASDATLWEKEQKSFAIVHDGLKVEIIEPEAVQAVNSSEQAPQTEETAQPSEPATEQGATEPSQTAPAEQPATEKEGEGDAHK